MILSSKIGALRGYREAAEEQAMQDNALYRAYSLLAGTQDASRRMDIAQGDIDRRQQQFAQAQELEREKMQQTGELERRRQNIEERGLNMRYSIPDPYRQEKIDELKEKAAMRDALIKASAFPLPISDPNIQRDIANLYASGYDDNQVYEAVKGKVWSALSRDDRYKPLNIDRMRFNKAETNPIEKKAIKEKYKDNPMLLEYITGSKSAGVTKEDAIMQRLDMLDKLMPKGDSSFVLPVVPNPPAPAPTDRRRQIA